MQSTKRTAGGAPSRQEVLEVFHFIWKNLDLAQTEIARGAGVDQGSVSKILNGSFRHLKGRAYRLWKYAKRRAEKAGYKAARPGAKSDPRLMEKINRVWDRTDEGAEALLKLLDAADLIQKRRRSPTVTRRKPR